MTNPPPPGNWTDPTWSAQPSSPAPDPTLVAGQPVPAATRPGRPVPPDPYAPADPYAGRSRRRPSRCPATPRPVTPRPATRRSTPATATRSRRRPTGWRSRRSVLALIGFASCITAPVGAILGHVAQKQIRLSGEGGAGMAKAAIIVGWILTGFLGAGDRSSTPPRSSTRSRRAPTAAAATDRRAGRRTAGRRAGPTAGGGRPGPTGHSAGGVNDEVRLIPAARPLAATTSAILRDASSIISSPSITAPSLPPASEV